MASRFKYSRWDGSQVGFDLDADALLEEMTDDLLYHGDLNAALRRMMQQGFQDREGRDVSGMREMLEKLRERRREQLDRYDLGGVYEDIANQLDEIGEQEREGIDRRVDEARASGDKRREDLLEDLAQQRRQELEQLPPDLAGRVSELQQYDWMDDAARQRFEELMEELKKQLLDSMFNQLQQGMSEMSPEQLARMKDMLAELNQMLEQRERGEEPDFEGFMERFGDFFPGNPQTLDELLEEAGLIEQREGRMELTPKGIRRIGQRALGDLFRKLLQDRPGRHEIERTGFGHERSNDHKQYEFGDPLHLDVARTIKNAITRAGAGTPVRITPEDFEIERTEQVTRSATVLMLDVSLSMEMRGRFLAAKKVAMALHALISSQFPRDYLGMVSFGRVAREVNPERLPEATWDFEWGTNMH